MISIVNVFCVVNQIASISSEEFVDPMWTVVEFTDSLTVEAVPTSWLFDNKQCYWPTFTREKLVQEIRNNSEPNTCWPLFNIRVFKDSTYDDYLTARRKCRKAEFTSDLNSENEEKRKIFPTAHRMDTSTSSESELSSLPDPPVLHRTNRKQLKKSTFLVNPIKENSTRTKRNIPTNEYMTEENTTNRKEKKSDNTAGATEDIPSNRKEKKNDNNDFTEETILVPSAQRIISVLQKHETFLMEILKKQSLLRAHLLQLQEDISKINLNKKSDEEQAIGDSFLKRFNCPINDIAELETLEAFLLDDVNFKNMVAQLRRIGGSDLYDFVRRCLSKIVTNNLASKFSYYGTKDKQPFKALKSSEAVQEAATLYDKEASQKGIEKAIQKWLLRAKERHQLKANKIS